MDLIEAVVIRSLPMAKKDHEGRKIEELVRAAGHTVSDLARCAGVSWPAAKKWIQAETLKPEARESAIRGMVALGVDPRAIWPIVAATAAENMDELRVLVDGFSLDQLRKVRRLLQAERANQIRMVDFIDGKLYNHRP